WAVGVESTGNVRVISSRRCPVAEAVGVALQDAARPGGQRGSDDDDCRGDQEGHGEADHVAAGCLDLWGDASPYAAAAGAVRAIPARGSARWADGKAAAQAHPGEDRGGAMPAQTGG